MKQFDKNEHSLPPDFSWLEMEDGIWEKVDHKERKRRFLWLFFFALLGSSAAWSIWMISAKATGEGKEKNNIASQIIEVEEVCLEEEICPVTSIEVGETSSYLNSQETNNQSIKNSVSPLLPATQIPSLVLQPPIRTNHSIPKLASKTKLLTTPVASISTPKIVVDSFTPYKRLTIHSGINSFEGNIKNQNISEINHDDLETSQIGMQVNLRYEWGTKKKGTYWGMGMNYTRLHSRFEYYSEREIIVIRDLYISPWELLLPREYLEQIYRQVQVKAIEKRRVIHHNSQNILDFSVYRGFQKHWKTVDLYANLGGRLNLIHWANGKIANASGEVVLLENMDYYKWNLGASLLLEGGFRYPINQQIDFSGQLGLQQNLNNWIRKEQFLRQSPRIYQLNFGLSYTFD